MPARAYAHAGQKWRNTEHKKKFATTTAQTARLKERKRERESETEREKERGRKVDVKNKGQAHKSKFAKPTLTELHSTPHYAPVLSHSTSGLHAHTHGHTLLGVVSCC